MATKPLKQNYIQFNIYKAQVISALLAGHKKNEIITEITKENLESQLQLDLASLNTDPCFAW